MPKKPRHVDALSPLDAITTMLTILMFTVLGVVVLAVASGSSSWTDGQDHPICRTPNFSAISPDDATAALRSPLTLTEGVSLRESRIEMCRDDPSIAQSVLDGLTSTPTLFVFIGFLFLTRRTIKYARRNGMFSSALAERIEALGWLLLLGLVAAAVIEWLADGLLKHSMVSSMSWHSGSFSISIAGIIGAYGIISIGRVMASAAVMHSDLEGTV